MTWGGGDLAHFWALQARFFALAEKIGWLVGNYLVLQQVLVHCRNREQQHNVFLCSQERKERRGAPTILLFSKEKIWSNDYPVSQGLDKHCFVACCPTQFHCHEIVCGFLKEKQGVEYTENDTPAPTNKKKNLKCEETSLFTMLCTVFMHLLSREL